MQCFNVKCNKTFNIGGDVLSPAYQSLIFDCFDLHKQKKYSYCVLNSAQAFEVFFSSFLTANLIFKPYKNNKYYVRELNEIIHQLSDAVEKFTYYKMRNIVFHMVIKDIQPNDFLEASAFIKNIKHYVGEPSISLFSAIKDTRKKEILLKIKESNVSKLRNNVVHKIAYRPTATEAESAINETRDILLEASGIFDIDKFLYHYM